MKTFFLLLLAIPFLFLTSCSVNDNHPEDTLAFLEISNTYKSADSPTEVSCYLMSIEGPRYSYSLDENLLEINNPINITKDTKFLVGTWNGLLLPDADGAVGMVNAYSSSSIIENVSLWGSESNDKIKITFEKNKAHVMINDKLSFTLNQGESHEFSSTYPGTNSECSYNITRTLAFKNNGGIPVKNVRCNNH